MGRIDFYIPSETRLVYHTDTSALETRVFRFGFFVAYEESKPTWSLLCDAKTERYSLPIPDTVCQTLSEKEELTPAFVDQTLLSYKNKLIDLLLKENNKQINLSEFLSAARGYVKKNENILFLFNQNTLQVDKFCNPTTPRFYMPIETTNNTLLVTSEEYLTRKNETLQFILFQDNMALEVDCLYQNNLFYIQRIYVLKQDKYQDLFKNIASLNTIHNKMSGQKNRLAILLDD